MSQPLAKGRAITVKLQNKSIAFEHTLTAEIINSNSLSRTDDEYVMGHGCGKWDWE